MSRFVILVLLLLWPAFAPGLSAQIVDASVCDILNNPESFDGKTVRVKGEVIAGFEEFVIKGADCNSPVDAIWLSYPSGTKAKAGPAATLQFQVSKNNSSEVSHSNPGGWPRLRLVAASGVPSPIALRRNSRPSHRPAFSSS
jgi:hypothetical protein